SDSLHGFASVIGDQSGLWSTSDAGISWQRTSLIGSGTSVSVTSKAIVVTDLFSNTQISIDGGITWKITTDVAKNDASFFDDYDGISTTYRGATWSTTSDGGVTWKPLSQNTEAWSVYTI